MTEPLDKRRESNTTIQLSSGKFNTDELAILIQTNVKEINEYLNGVLEVSENISNVKDLLKRKDLLELVVILKKVNNYQ